MADRLIKQAVNHFCGPELALNVFNVQIRETPKWEHGKVTIPLELFLVKPLQHINKKELRLLTWLHASYCSLKFRFKKSGTTKTYYVSVLQM